MRTRVDAVYRYLHTRVERPVEDKTSGKAEFSHLEFDETPQSSRHGGANFASSHRTREIHILR